MEKMLYALSSNCTQSLHEHENTISVYDMRYRDRLTVAQPERNYLYANPGKRLKKYAWKLLNFGATLRVASNVKNQKYYINVTL